MNRTSTVNQSSLEPAMAPNTVNPNMGYMMQNNPLIQALSWLKANYDIRINISDKSAEFKKKEDSDYERLTDRDLNQFKIDLAKLGVNISVQNLYQNIHSMEFPSFDPYVEFFDSLPEWDGEKDYIQELADTVQCEDQDYWRLSLKKWLVAVVATLHEEDVVNQFCPLLLSPVQGIGKSTFWNKIVPLELKHYTHEGRIDTRDKDSQTLLSTCAFINLDEAENLSKNTIEATKAMITQEKIFMRKPYAREVESYPRRASFMGSSNSPKLLYDSSNRRFGCMRVLDINLKALRDIDMHSVYAQALELYKSGFQYWFEGDEIKMIEKHNGSFRVVSAEEEIITEYYSPCSPDDEGAKQMTPTELFTTIRLKSQNKNMAIEAMGKTLSQLGFAEKHSNGKKYWIVKENSSQEENNEE